MPATGFKAAQRQSRARFGLVGLGALCATAWVVACALLQSEAPAATEGFVSGAAPAPKALRGGVAVFAEAAPSPSPSPSVALVKVTEENKVTTASVLGGLAGLLVGGVWVGGALFAAGSYLSRKDDDVSKALKGVASGSLEVLNFGAYLNDKYAVTDKLGSAVTDAVEGAKSSPDNKASIESATSFLDGVKKTIEDADKEVGFKETFGTLTTSASDLASQAVDKAVELNSQYKITDQLKEKIDEAIDGAKRSSSGSTTKPSS